MSKIFPGSPKKMSTGGCGEVRNLSRGSHDNGRKGFNDYKTSMITDEDTLRGLLSYQDLDI
jgi:hypothetical protein